MGVGIARRLAWAAEDIRRYGIGAVWHRLRGRLTPAGRASRRRKADDDEAFDAQGYETGGKELVEILNVVGGSAASSEHYSVTASYDFAEAIATLDVTPRGFVFVDIGSGKGRVVLLAADYPFDRVIGVEFASELHEIALANLRRRQELHGPDPRIELVHGDAVDFRLPEAPLVLFLFNPFKPPVLTAVARNILASWRRNPRPIRVIYLNPVHADEWVAEGFDQVGAAPDYRFLIYAPRPAG